MATIESQDLLRQRIPCVAADQRQATGHFIPVSAIRSSEKHARRIFNDEALDQLAASIQQWGQLQPITVRNIGPYYELISGERRWRAHVRAGLPLIWAVERDASQEMGYILGLVENFHSEALTHAEQIAAIDQLAEITKHMGLRYIAGLLGVDPSWLSRKIAVCHDQTVFPALELGRIGFGQAAELLRAPEASRSELLARIIEAKHTVSAKTVRDWVEDARYACNCAPTKAAIRREDMSSYTAVYTALELLQQPNAEDEYSILRSIIALSERRLRRAHLAYNGSTLLRKKKNFELRCTTCGKVAGRLEQETYILPEAEDRIRQEHQRLVCGCCGGSLGADHLE